MKGVGGAGGRLTWTASARGPGMADRSDSTAGRLQSIDCSAARRARRRAAVIQRGAWSRYRSSSTRKPENPTIKLSQRARKAC
jgi:hypothetical protein